FIYRQYNRVHAEVWAIGLIFYRLTTGNGNSRKSIWKIANGELDLSNAQLSPQFEDLIRQCLAFNPYNRISMENLLCHPFINFSSKKIIENVNNENVNNNQQQQQQN
ncbi:MAG: hypothetical protein QWI73_06980, partial [Alphaproteobacteria bacterium]|nr:hypothetical protein [Alphaproteobacteria bacterium]